MTVEVTVYGPLRSATGGKRVELDAEPETARAALEALAEAHPRARSHLFDDGAVRPSVRVTADGDAVEPDDELPAGAALSVHPAVRGGRR